MSAQWHVLTTDQIFPTLLVQATFDNGGYHLRLSDLSRVWSQDLRRREINTEAKRRKCSIDPSEDDEQYDIFTSKLQSALQQEDQTSLALCTASNDVLKLSVSAPLPSPLPALTWDFGVERMDDDQVNMLLVSPLLQHADHLRQQIAQLVAELQAKDKIISKITDRLDASGHDLTEVFPGVSNSKLSHKKQLEQLARNVKGLGTFDEESWTQKHAKAPSNFQDLSPGDINDILTSLRSPSAASHSTGAGWWRNLSKPRKLGAENAPDHDRAEERSNDAVWKQHSREAEDAGDILRDDGFQRQATPTRLTKDSPAEVVNSIEDTKANDAGKAPPSYHAEESTDDEDDLDGPSQARAASSKPPPPATTESSPPSKSDNNPPPPKKSNTPPADHDNELSPTSQSPPSKPQTRTTAPPANDSDTEEEDDLDASAPPPQPSQSRSPAPKAKLGAIGGRRKTKTKSPSPPAEPSPEPKPKPKSKLGAIGGKRKEATASPKAKEPTPEPPATASAKPSPRKLGAIGGRGKRGASPAGRGRTATPANGEGGPAGEKGKDEKEAERPRESSQERADRKREQLKREVEEKAKAPVRKKRKF